MKLSSFTTDLYGKTYIKVIQFNKILTLGSGTLNCDQA